MILEKNLYHEKGFVKGIFNYVISLVSFYGRMFLGLKRENVELSHFDSVNGIPYLVTDEKGAIHCNSCSLCEQKCQTNAIKLVGAKDNLSGPPKDFEININLCTLCGDCISICPEKALANSQVNTISFDKDDNKIFNKEVLKSFTREVKKPLQMKEELQKKSEKAEK